jgi:hypothetical protein
MKKILIQYLYIFAFALVFLALAFATLNKKDPNPLENIEQRLEEVEVKDKVLTDSEKELEKKATEKEWQEVDKQTDK